jgi:hypothetical protein
MFLPFLYMPNKEGTMYEDGPFDHDREARRQRREEEERALYEELDRLEEEEDEESLLWNEE